MKEPKIMGFIIAWAAEDWIRPAIKQALEYCDEVLVAIVAFNPELNKFADSTYNICKEYRDIKLLDFKPTNQYASQVKSETLNFMLKNSALHIVGNWIWILDVDEFYFEQTHKKIRQIINEKRHLRIGIKAKIFYVNMQHYLRNSTYWRLFKISDMKDRFKATQHWPREHVSDYLFSKEDIMFHYSLLTNTDIRLAWWKANLPNITHAGRRGWLNDIYLNYDLENEDYWIGRNLKVSGLKSPSFYKGWRGDENGRLLRYDDKHPKFIEETELPKIKDFRIFYDRKESAR